LAALDRSLGMDKLALGGGAGPPFNVDDSGLRIGDVDWGAVLIIGVEEVGIIGGDGDGEGAVDDDQSRSILCKASAAEVELTGEALAPAAGGFTGTGADMLLAAVEELSPRRSPLWCLLLAACPGLTTRVGGGVELEEFPPPLGARPRRACCCCC